MYKLTRRGVEPTDTSTVNVLPYQTPASRSVAGGGFCKARMSDVDVAHEEVQ
jgi:hypothetical protein